MVRPKVTRQTHPRVTTESEPKGARLIAQRDGRKLGSFADIRGLGSRYLGRVVEAIEGCTASLAFSTARTRLVAVRHFFLFLASMRIPEATQLKTALRNDDVGALETRSAHIVELAYREHLRNKYRPGSSTLASAIGDTNRALCSLSSRALWPHTLRLPIERIDEGEIDVRASVLEAIGTTKDSVRDIRGADVRKEAALQGLQRLGVPAPTDDAEISAAILRGESECLERMKSAARSIFEQLHAAWANMQPRIADAHNADGAALEAWIAEAIDVTAKQRRNRSFDRQTRRLFPKTEEGLARLLALVEITYMRGAESGFNLIAPPLRAQLNFKVFQAVCRAYPALATLNLRYAYPIDGIRGLLTPSKLCVGSAAVLLMLETGMNTSPTISLPWDQVVARENDRWLSIATWKERAGGTLLEEELVVSRPGEPTSAGAALLALRQMAARHDSFIGADVKHKSHVFAHASGHAGDAEHPRFRSLTTVSFKTAFDTVSLAAFGQRPVPAPSSARASLLMVVRGHSPSIRKTQLTAGHKRADTTLRHYAGKARAAHHIDHMTAIRDFQKRLEQIAMHNMLPNRLLAEEEAYATRLHDAIRTGLGVLCIRPPPSEEPDPLDGCASIEKCPNCTNVRLATTPEELADLIAFGEHLAEHEDWLQSHRPEAWMTRWLYWSLLIDEVIKRGARSVWAPNLKRAREIHASRPKPRFPPLW